MEDRGTGRRSESHDRKRRAELFISLALSLPEWRGAGKSRSYPGTAAAPDATAPPWPAHGETASLQCAFLQQPAPANSNLPTVGVAATDTLPLTPHHLQPAAPTIPVTGWALTELGPLTTSMPGCLPLFPYGASAPAFPLQVLPLPGQALLRKSPRLWAGTSPGCSIDELRRGKAFVGHFPSALRLPSYMGFTSTSHVNDQSQSVPRKRLREESHHLTGDLKPSSTWKSVRYPDQTRRPLTRPITTTSDPTIRSARRTS